MTHRPTPSLFEARLAAAFAAYADRAPMDVDAVTLTAAVASGPAARRSPLAGARRNLVPMLLGLLLVALVAGAALVGSGFFDRRPDADTPQQPALVAPSAAPSAAPVAEPSVQPTRQPDPSERPPADQPCAAMIRLLFPYAPLENPADPIPAVGPVIGNGDLLVRTVEDGPGIGRLDASQSPPTPVRPSDGVELPFASAIISSGIDPSARMVASPDGRALAFEAGDFGQAGCGDPIVVPAGSGLGGTPTSLRRPFSGRAFELVSDLAWAPDGSALYGIRRPTLDALGQPYTANSALATVVRWDTASAEVTELPAGCESCSQLFVSPDGTHIAAEGAGGIRLYDADGGWRELPLGDFGDGLLGWADDSSVVMRTGRVNLEGEWVVRWEELQGALLSPDGTTIAYTTGSNDRKHLDVTLMDVGDGSTRVAWSVLIGGDCDALSLSARSTCLAIGGYAQPGPDTFSVLARIAAWAPDGSAVLLWDESSGPDATTVGTLQVVPVDGSRLGSKVTIDDPALSERLNWAPSIVWLPATATTP